MLLLKCLVALIFQHFLYSAPTPAAAGLNILALGSEKIQRQNMFADI